MPDITAANPDIATPELMKAISAAFNSRDVDRIVSHFTDDATFWLARGPVLSFIFHVAGGSL